MGKLTEKDLIVPALACMLGNGGSATIAQLRDHIAASYPLSDEDLTPSPTRPGERVYEQQIRNLRSHDTLARLGLAENIDGGFRLLPAGEELLSNNADLVFSALASSDTSTLKRISAIDRNRRIVSLGETIPEGAPKTKKDAERHSRSAKLRSEAIKTFTDEHGVISCYCCGMDFGAVYGPVFGASCIEIHHKKPIFMYEDEDLVKTLGEALRNVVALCPNCHSVVHKNKLFSDDGIEHLKSEISKQRGEQ